MTMSQRVYSLLVLVFGTFFTHSALLSIGLVIGGDDGYRDVLLTFSAGLVAHRLGEPTERVIARADAALYQAKAAGRNRVMLG